VSEREADDPDLAVDALEVSGRIRKVAGGAALVLVSGAAQFVIATAYHVIVARHLGAASYGLLILGQTVSIFLGQIGLLGLDWGVLRFGAIAFGQGDMARLRAVVWRGLIGVLGAGVAGAALLAVASQVVADTFDKPALARVLIPLAMAIPFTAGADLMQAALRVMGRAAASTSMQYLVTPVLRVGVVVVVVAGGGDVRSVAIGYTVAEVGAFLATFAVLVARLPRAAGAVASGPVDGMYRFSFSMLLNRLVLYPNDESEVFVLGLLRASGPVGVFGVAKRLSLILGTLLSSTGLLLNPMSAELHHQGRLRELERLFAVTTRWLFTLGLPVCLVEVLFARDVVTAFGAEFASGASVLAILAIGQLVNVGTGTVAGLLAMVGESRLTLFNSLLFLGLSLGFDFALIPIYGVVGAAVANATALAVMNVLRVVQMRRRLGFRVYDARFLKPLGAGALAGVIAYVLPSPWTGVARLALRGGVLLAVYFATLLVLRVEPEDRDVARAALRRVRPAPAPPR
jgi:O-antigen/teichoic acid export membrane protein